MVFIIYLSTADVCVVGVQSINNYIKIISFQSSNNKELCKTSDFAP